MNDWCLPILGGHHGSEWGRPAATGMGGKWRVGTAHRHWRPRWQQGGRGWAVTTRRSQRRWPILGGPMPPSPQIQGHSMSLGLDLLLQPSRWPLHSPYVVLQRETACKRVWVTQLKALCTTLICHQEDWRPYRAPWDICTRPTWLCNSSDFEHSILGASICIKTKSAWVD